MSIPKKANISKLSLRFGKKLRDLRFKQELTQEEVAELAGMDLRHYQRLESKTPNTVTLDSIHRLAKAFGVKPSKLTDL